MKARQGKYKQYEIRAKCNYQAERLGKKCDSSNKAL